MKRSDEEQEPYRLYVTDREAQVFNRFDQQRAYIYLWGGGVDAIWVLQIVGIWSDLSEILFGNRYKEQMQFKRREEAIRHVEGKLGVKRDSIPPKRLTPLPGMTMWETEDAADRGDR